MACSPKRLPRLRWVNRCYRIDRVRLRTYHYCTESCSVKRLQCPAFGLLTLLGCSFVSVFYPFLTAERLTLSTRCTKRLYKFSFTVNTFENEVINRNRKGPGIQLLKRAPFYLPCLPNWVPCQFTALS